LLPELLAMLDDTKRELGFQYAVHSPIVGDALGAAELAGIARQLGRKWNDRFARLANELAGHFAKAVGRRVDTALAYYLRRSGFAIRFSLTQAQAEALEATTAANVALIKSISSQHATAVEGAVMRSIQTGKDVAGLARELREIGGVTRRRALFIARDQNAKATATITRVRQQELGITTARWLHSGGGKEPRPSHVKAGRDRVEYDVAKGWFDPDEGRFIQPGELINCRCTSVSIIPGF
jgi:F like protein